MALMRCSAPQVPYSLTEQSRLLPGARFPPELEQTKYYYSGPERAHSSQFASDPSTTLKYDGSATLYECFNNAVAKFRSCLERAAGNGNNNAAERNFLGTRAGGNGPYEWISYKDVWTRTSRFFAKSPF